MVMSAFVKDIFRSIRYSLSRFFSIVAIVALGAGVYAGLAAVAPDMWDTGDDYFDTQNLMDLRLISTYGFTEEDIHAIRQEQGVLGVFATYSADVVADIGDAEYTLRLHGLPEDPTRMGDDDINMPVLLEGRWPQRQDECVLVKKAVDADYEQIGSLISVPNEDGALDNTLECFQYTVVGIVESPYYLSFTLGTTDQGNGTLYYAAYVPQDAFSAEVYTDLYVTVEGAKALSAFEEEYKSLAGQEKVRLEELADQREQIRLGEIQDQANEELEEARQEYEQARTETEEELADAAAQLEDARKQIAKGEQELAAGQREYEDGVQELSQQKAAYQQGMEEAEQKLADTEAQVTQGRQQLEQARAELENYESLFEQESANAQQQLEEEKQKLQAWSAELKELADEIAAAEQIEEQGGSVPELPAMREEYAKQSAQFVAAQKQLEQAIAQGQEELQAQREQLDAAWEEYDANAAAMEQAAQALEEGKQELEGQKAAAQAEFESAEQRLNAARRQLQSARAELEEGRKELAEGEQEYADGQAEAQKQLEDAEQQIKDAEQQIAELEAPVWYILDRDATESVVLYDGCAERMNQLKTVFPVVFFLVAALVALTTMTRMVDEERGLIGTYKALGYSNAKIGFKYLFYAAFATLLGTALGIGIGMYLLPQIIWNAYGIMFSLPEMIIDFRWGIALQAMGALLAFTLGATYLACRASLFEVPARLLQPRAPKPGKRILLERIGFLWKRLNFTAKTTARNLFLNKRRLIMTVAGVAGCTGLLVTAMGIRDSVGSILENQFEGIYQFDVMTTLEKEQMSPELEEALEDPDLFEGYLQTVNRNMNVTSADGGDTMTAYLYIPKEPERIEEFVNLRRRQDQSPIPLRDDSVIITEKLADNLDLEIGDTLRVQAVAASDAQDMELTVTNICENYVFNYIYISPQLYRQVADEEPEYTQLVIKTNPQNNDAAIEKLRSFSEELLTVTLNADIIGSVQGSIDSVNVIILVLIAFAGILAFIVLYNLTNINVGERVREIATLKVLGFRAKETNSYIFRETLVLSLLGCVLGLGLGTILYQYVVRTVEVDNMMLGRTVSFAGYLMAVVLTMLFTWIVSLFINKRIRQVDMVESLKSVD